MKVPEAAIVLDPYLAWSLAIAIGAIGTSLSGAVVTLWKSSQTSRKEANGLYRELATANTDDAVHKEQVNGLLKEIAKAQETGKTSIHARFDKIENKLEKLT